VGGGWQLILFLVKNSLVKKEMWDGVLSWCNSQFFCGQSSEQTLHIFSHIHYKRHSGMWNWLFSLPGRILCEQSPWCQRNDDHALDFAPHFL
jgi:hypothetical protein